MVTSEHDYYTCTMNIGISGHFTVNMLHTASEKFPSIVSRFYIKAGNN